MDHLVLQFLGEYEAPTGLYNIDNVMALDTGY